MAFFPCKEEFIEFERLARRQHRIYQDACDYGLLMSEFDVNRARDNLRNMMEVFKDPVYHYKAEKWHNGKSVEFEIPIEMDEGQYLGYKFKVSFNKDPGRRIEFITIDITHGRLQYDGR